MTSPVSSGGLLPSDYCRADKAIPEASFGRNTTGLGAAPKVHSSPLAQSSKGIKIVGVFCDTESAALSRKRQRCANDPETKISKSSDDDTKPTVDCTSPLDETIEERHKPRIYVQCAVDRCVEMLLPLEVMRRRHPQILIDYLLSTAQFV